MVRSHTLGTLSLVAAFVTALATVPLAAQDTPRPSRAMSTSGQFVVYSKDAAWRTAASRRAEAVRTAWNRWLDDPGRPVNAIIIQDLRTSARPKGNPRAVTAIYEGDGGALKVQTDIYDASLMAAEGFEAEIFRALALELIYRNQPMRAGKAFRGAPDWVIEGLTEDQRVARVGSPDGVYAILLRSDRPPKLEDFLKSRPETMDATTLAIYRTQALALLRSLVQLPERGAGLVAFLVSVHETDPSLKSLLAAFPSLNNDPAQLGKIWTLTIARGSTGKRLEPLSVAQTESALVEILDFTAPKDPRKADGEIVTGPMAMSLVARGEGGPFIMRQKAAELLALEMRAHPVMKPVITEYREMADELADRPRRNVEKRLEEAGKIRELLAQRSGGVGDYLNWFEATQLDTLSGAFLQVTEAPKAPPRTDPITRHLDAIDRRGW